MPTVKIDNALRINALTRRMPRMPRKKFRAAHIEAGGNTDIRAKMLNMLFLIKITLRAPKPQRCS
jgi:hypothetical protein